MKLSLSADDEAFRSELVAFLEAKCPPQARSSQYFIGSDAADAEGVVLIPDWARQWQACLFDHGWMVPGYGPELGGRNATPTQTLLYLEGLAARGMLRSLHFVG